MQRRISTLREPVRFRDALGDGIIVVNDRGIILDSNPAVCKLLCAEASNLTGRHLAECFDYFQDKESNARLFDRRQFDGSLLTEALRPDGERIPVQITFGEWPDDGNIRYILSVRDFRSVESEHRRTLRSGSLAAIADTMKALAHESRNVLQRMQSCLMLIRLRSETDLHDLVDDMQEAQDQLQQLYEDVRNFAAPIALGLHPTDAVELLDDVWRELEPEWQAKGLGLATSGASAQLRAIPADSSRLKQVFRNLLKNAIEASPPEGLIRAQFETVNSPKPAIRISIEDEGPGIAPEKFDRIFELLFTSKDHGSGMGLAIARRIVNEHDGEMSAEAGRSVGARFVMELPR